MRPEQHEILAGIARIFVSKQLKALQRAAQRVDLRNKKIVVTRTVSPLAADSAAAGTLPAVPSLPVKVPA